MREFLRLIEENNPDAANYKLTLTIENQAGDVDEVLEREISGHEAAGDLWVALGKILHPAEDQEGDASDPRMSEIVPGGAQAVQRRRAIDDKIIQTYNNETQELFNLQSNM